MGEGKPVEGDNSGATADTSVGPDTLADDSENRHRLAAEMLQENDGQPDEPDLDELRQDFDVLSTELQMVERKSDANPGNRELKALLDDLTVETIRAEAVLRRAEGLLDRADLLDRKHELLPVLQDSIRVRDDYANTYHELTKTYQELVAKGETDEAKATRTKVFRTYVLYLEASSLAHENSAQWSDLDAAEFSLNGMHDHANGSALLATAHERHASVDRRIAFWAMYQVGDLEEIARTRVSAHLTESLGEQTLATAWHQAGRPELADEHTARRFVAERRAQQVPRPDDAT